METITLHGVTYPVITTAHGVRYRQQTFVDAWGRHRVCEKLLRDLPQPHPAVCAVCGAPITAARATKRFCRPACKMKDYRQRRPPP